MSITEVESYTLELLQEHLPDDWHNWKVNFMYSKNILGTTYYPTKVIEISLWAIQYTTSEDVMAIIKHEVAHAIAFDNFGNVGHNQIWQWICKFFVFCEAEESRRVTLVN